MSPDGTPVAPAPSTPSTSAEPAPTARPSGRPLRKNKRMLGLRPTPPRVKRARSDNGEQLLAGITALPSGACSTNAGRSKPGAGADRDLDAVSLGSTACSPTSSIMVHPAATVASQASRRGAATASPAGASSAGVVAGRSPSPAGSPAPAAAGADPGTAAMLKLAPVADAEGIVWTKIKGHPFWPSQVVNVTPKLAAQDRFKAAARFKRRGDDTCVQYFGTLEIAWIEKDKSTISWTHGVERKLHSVLRKRFAYTDALNEVRGYCARQTRYPRGWWCEPPCLIFAAEFVQCCAKEGHPDHRPPAPAAYNPRKMWTIARSDRVVWAKVRGFPDWPVQIIPVDKARSLFPELKLQPAGGPASPKLAQRPAGSRPSAGASVPCMFFGTCEVANVPERSITEFDDGVEAGHVTASDRRDFRVALGEVYGFLKSPRVWPSGFAAPRLWWNAPEESTDEDDDAVEARVPASAPKFEFLRRSVWPEGESPPPRSKRSEIPVCACSPNPSGACVDASCLNFMSQIICDPGTCPAGETCRNVSFHRRPKRALRPFYTSDDRGWGLRTSKRIPKGEFVVEYVGEIIDKVECERRLKAVQRRGDSDYYMMEISSDHVLDAAAKGNLSRYINSSCSPTCATQKWIDAATGQTRVGIFALDDVPAGSELLYNYCFQDFGLASKRGKRSFTCRCGSPTCCMYEEGEYQRTSKVAGRRVKVSATHGIQIVDVPNVARCATLTAQFLFLSRLGALGRRSLHGDCDEVRSRREGIHCALRRRRLREARPRREPCVWWGCGLQTAPARCGHVRETKRWGTAAPRSRFCRRTLRRDGGPDVQRSLSRCRPPPPPPHRASAHEPC
jgi:hypothetical protein